MDDLVTGPLPDRPVTVGLGLYTGQQPPGAAEPHYADAAELAVAAEGAGFDAFWVSEHHGFPDGYLPSPLIALAGVATRTSRIALGTGVVVAPLAHPLHLAEDAAVLDRLSGGRLVLGLGLGYAEHEYRSFGVDTRTRGAALTDLVAFLRTAWRGEPFDWDGPCYRGEGLRVTPTPVANGVPIWLGGYADAAVRRAARCGDGYLLGRADPPIVECVDALLRTDLPAPGDFTVALNVIVVLDDDPADEASARHGLAYQQAAYEAIQAGGIAHAGRVTVARDAISAQNVADYVHVHGTSGHVAERLREIVSGLRHWPRIHLVIRALFPEREVRVQRARIEALGRTVLPALRTG
jgi:probable F420-dependent oxidoreductase